MTGQLPGGGKAWFVRFRTEEGPQIEPASVEGWVLTIVYLIGLAAISWVFLSAAPDAGDWFAWAVLATAGTFLFLVTVCRMSVSVAGPTSRRRWARPKGRLLAALFAASLVIAGALAVALL